MQDGWSDCQRNWQEARLCQSRQKSKMAVATVGNYYNDDYDRTDNDCGSNDNYHYDDRGR